MSNRFNPLIAAFYGAIGAGLLLFSATASAIDLGDASVMSQRGQRLKIAIPYGSSPGERLAVTRFEVQSISTTDGYPVLRADNFTISKPARRNIVYLQSRDVVQAPDVKLVLAVRDGQSPSIAYNLAVPEAKASPPTLDDSAPIAKRSKASVKSARNGSVPSRASRPAGQSPAGVLPAAPVDSAVVGSAPNLLPPG